MPAEKQHEPTQSRLDRAKREGDAARSQDLSNVMAFASGLFALAFALAPLSGALRKALIAAASGRYDGGALASAGALMLVPAACAGCGAVISSVWQGGGLRLAAPAIKLERLAPGENLKRILSRETAIGAARAIIAFACTAAMLLPVMGRVYGAALRGSGVSAVAGEAWRGALTSAAAACAIAAFFAAGDYGVQWARWRKRLRMSFEELKRDQKEHDGDPLVRGRRRALQRQMARGSLQRVKDAAFVLTNPTQLAVALEYRPPEVPVPRVLVSAADEAAARVRRLAAAHRIPIVENVPLARALYAGARPGESIPHETYLAVAEVVAALNAARVLAQ